MSAAQVVLDGSSFVLLVVLVALASLAALVASAAAWGAAKSARTALNQLETARREVVVPDREWQERSPIPQRSSDFVGSPVPPDELAPPRTAEGLRSAAPPPRARVPERAVAPPVRFSDALDDPDRPGSLARADDRPIRPATPPADDLRTEPLSRAHPSLLMPVPPVAPDAAAEREVDPGVFVTSPGRPPAPAPVASVPEPHAAPEPTVPSPESAAFAPEVAQPAAWPLEAAPEPAPAPPVDPSAARLQRLDDPDPFVRIEAIEGLRGHPALVDALLRALHDDFPVVRRKAVRALKESGGPSAIKALLEVANQDPSAEVREEAVNALAELLRDVRTNPA